MINNLEKSLIQFFQTDDVLKSCIKAIYNKVPDKPLYPFIYIKNVLPIPAFYIAKELKYIEIILCICSNEKHLKDCMYVLDFLNMINFSKKIKIQDDEIISIKDSKVYSTKSGLWIIEISLSYTYLVNESSDI